MLMCGATVTNVEPILELNSLPNTVHMYYISSCLSKMLSV